MQAPFGSPEEFRQAFEQGLRRLLDEPGLGPLILALANAALDEGLFDRLRSPLRAGFEAKAGACIDALRRGAPPADADDDLLVFLKLMAVGLDSVRPSEWRRAGPWELQFNHLRAFRPRRMGAGVLSGIRRPFDPSGFHFNRPFLRPEIFWSGSLGGRAVALFYNKFPFVCGHGLLVVEPQACRAQYLERADHFHAWECTETLAKTLPAVGLAYNSYGAFASVNHLHFQTFLLERPLPVVQSSWAHNGGDQAYPLECLRLGSASGAWTILEELHRSETSYNLIYLPGTLYCLPRAKQGSYPDAPWSAGFGWYELAGGFTTFNREDFEGLEAGDIARELARLALPAGPADQAGSSLARGKGRPMA